MKSFILATVLAASTVTTLSLPAQAQNQMCKYYTNTTLPYLTSAALMNQNHYFSVPSDAQGEDAPQYALIIKETLTRTRISESGSEWLAQISTRKVEAIEHHFSLKLYSIKDLQNPIWNETSGYTVRTNESVDETQERAQALSIALDTIIDCPTYAESAPHIID